jgi:hypothetical protein
VATAEEDRLSFLPQSAHVVCGSHRRHNWRRTSRLEDQNDKKKSRHSGSVFLGGVKVQRWLDDAPLMIDKP